MVWPWPRPHALPPTVEFNSTGWGCTEHLKVEQLPVLQRLLHRLQRNTAPNFLDLVLRGTRWGTRNIWLFWKQQWASLHWTKENFYLRAEDTWTFGSNLGKQRRPEGCFVCVFGGPGGLKGHPCHEGNRCWVLHWELVSFFSFFVANLPFV